MNKVSLPATLARATFLSFIAALVIMPLVATVLGGFKTVGELRASPFGLPWVWHFDTYLGILGSPTFWNFLGNSLVISLTAVALTLLCASMAAFVFAQIQFFGSRYLQSYLLLGMMFPFATAIVPLFIQVRDFGLLDNPLGVILPQTAFSMAFAIVLLKSFFEQLPKELFEAAHVDGCGYIGFFFRFTLPLSTPILATVGTFVFVQSWNNYLLPLVVLNDRSLFTWPLGIMQFRGEFIVEWNKILAFVSLTILPALVFFAVTQKYIVAGLTRGSVKG
ncbi:carbohydrate ABC transporter permease [Telmatospirillum sp.]|uniref:carbohydrate ABC transporter permease n=1 Tax=Telmatospirillum sp. TaxID=2079197 RepID=UPI00283F67A2|nr:carbohydrate ABC transporter permease [Telmatospirillum sp.]MDR3438766.1 carbohydrate ABC transporter permease [Telmatospirillum sp.]